MTTLSSDRCGNKSKNGYGGKGTDRDNYWNSGQQAGRFQSDAENDELEVDASSWCFAAVTTPTKLAGTLLVDSGADDHICHPEYAKESPSKKSTGLKLRDVQGNTLSHHGTRHVNLTVGTQGQRANIDFQVADISDDRLSLDKLLRNGIVSRLNGENGSFFCHPNQHDIFIVFAQEKFACSCETADSSCETCCGR